MTDTKIHRAKLAGYSSVVGQPIMLLSKAGNCIGQLALIGAAGDYREAVKEVAALINASVHSETVEARAEAAEAERDAWREQHNRLQVESAFCFAAQDEIDGAWDAIGTAGNRQILTLPEQISALCRDYDDRAEAAEAAHAATKAALDEAVGVIYGCVASIEHADMSDGVCCCGDEMATHAGPISCGHSPVDAGEYYAGMTSDARKLTLMARLREFVEDLLSGRDRDDDWRVDARAIITSKGGEG